MAADGRTKGIRKELVTRLGHEGAVTRYRFSVETSLQQIFDIYIPDVLYHQDATQRFLVRLRSLTQGATVYQAVEGDWNHEIEAVRVMRLAIMITDGKGARIWEIDSVRDALRGAVTDFMVDLQESGAPLEEAVFFNDWSARGTIVARVPCDGEVV